jgi:hypothetical protein
MWILDSEEGFKRSGGVCYESDCVWASVAVYVVTQGTWKIKPSQLIHVCDISRNTVCLSVAVKLVVPESGLVY